MEVSCFRVLVEVKAGIVVAVTTWINERHGKVNWRKGWIGERLVRSTTKWLKAGQRGGCAGAHC